MTGEEPLTLPSAGQGRDKRESAAFGFVIDFHKH